MNPLTTVSVSGSLETTQGLDGSRQTRSLQEGQNDRQQQVERSNQPTAAATVQISDTARARASEELTATQTVGASNATSERGAEIREFEENAGNVGRLVDERA